MNQRENLLALLRREPFEWIPPQFDLCPSLVEEYNRQTGGDISYYEYFEMPWSGIGDTSHQKAAVDEVHKRGLAAVAFAQFHMRKPA